MDGWNSHRILAEIRARGISLTRLSLRHGLGRDGLAATLQKPNARGEAVISRFLGVAAHVLWPDRYDREGRRLKPQPARNYRPAARLRRAA